MTILERCVGRQDNVNLDEKFVACVVGTKVLDLTNGRGESHSKIEEKVALVWLSRKAGEVAYVVDRDPAPVDNDDKG